MRFVAMNTHRSGALLALLIASAVAVSIMAMVGPKPAEAAFPGTNGKIAFDSDRDQAGQSEIYVMNPNGSLPTRLTNNPGTFDDNPSFSPNGRKIVFESGRDGISDIYMMDAVDSDSDSNGDNLKRLTKNMAIDEGAAFSPSGTKIAFESNRSGNSEIYVMKAKPEGKKNRPRKLTNNAAFDGEPSFSPDGTKIVFTSDRDGADNIYVMNVDGTGLTQLTADPAFDSDPSFSPDGAKIVFRSGRVSGDDSEVFVMDVQDVKDNVTGDPGPDGEGDNMTNITHDPQESDAFPAFSPDGTKIVFSRTGTTEREIWVIKADGSGDGLTQLTTNDDADNRPDWGVLPT